MTSASHTNTEGAANLIVHGPKSNLLSDSVKVAGLSRPARTSVCDPRSVEPSRRDERKHLLLMTNPYPQTAAGQFGNIRNFTLFLRK